LPELADQPGLADPGVAQNRQQLRPAVALDPTVRRPQPPELIVAADEDGLQAADPTRAHQRESAYEPPTNDAARLSLRLDRPRLRELEGAARSSDRPLADEGLAPGSGLLEACADVDGIARDERAALSRPPDDHVAGVDADA
jgi:hypothetical protein